MIEGMVLGIIAFAVGGIIGIVAIVVGMETYYRHRYRR